MARKRIMFSAGCTAWRLKITDTKRKTNEHGKKRRRKRRRSPFFPVFILILLISCGIGVSLMVFFKVENIKVAGESRYTEQQIAAACGIKTGQNLLAIDKKKAQSELCEKLPYIKSAAVKLKPLSTVIIDVVKDTPCGVVQSGGSYYIIDDNLKILDISNDASSAKGMPVIKGLTAENAARGRKIVINKQKTINFIVDLYNSLKDNKIEATKITSINVSDSYELSVRYDNRINILLGTSSYIDYKIKSALYIIKNQLGPNEKGKLDVSETVPDSSDKHKIFFDADT